MPLGEKIKVLRTQNGITQEKLAERLNVSRSAVAKWETGGGLPDIYNLKMISELFSVSIDYLVIDEVTANNEDCKNHEVTTRSPFIGQMCNIDLKGWDDGVYDVLILNEDDFFLFYQSPFKKGQPRGLINKKSIKSIEASKNSFPLEEDMMPIDYAYFCNKSVMIELAKKEGLLRGFFDFRDDDYRNVVIKTFSDSRIKLIYGGELDILEVSKIEEL